MKFVVKSLLFVNLILQMTSSLRKCFDHDQNLMLTIILLAFSLIGLIGLIIGNRFILIIFAACITLILIASITIYAINRSEKDEFQPKVPYYINNPNIDSHNREDSRHKSGSDKIKSFVNKLLNKNQQDKKHTRNRSRGQLNRTTNPLDSNEQRINARSSLKSINSNLPTTNIPYPNNDDYSDEPMNSLPVNHMKDLPTGRGMSTANGKSDQMSEIIGDDNRNGNPENKLGKLYTNDKDQDQSGDLGENQVQSEQWIAYERRIYERYLNMVSQSIDLVLHTILASWMALLLDEDSDKCFGNNSRSRSVSKSKNKPNYIPRETSTYNYNGVRYSIRPDTNESPTRVVVR